MDAGLLVAIVAVIGVALFVWWLLVLIEALRTPASQWEAAGQNQFVYIVLIVLLGVIGTVRPSTSPWPARSCAAPVHRRPHRSARECVPAGSVLDRLDLFEDLDAGCAHDSGLFHGDLAFGAVTELLGGFRRVETRNDGDVVLVLDVSVDTVKQPRGACGKLSKALFQVS